MTYPICAPLRRVGSKLALVHDRLRAEVQRSTVPQSEPAEPRGKVTQSADFRHKEREHSSCRPEKVEEQNSPKETKADCALPVLATPIAQRKTRPRCPIVREEA